MSHLIKRAVPSVTTSDVKVIRDDALPTFRRVVEHVGRQLLRSDGRAVHPVGHFVGLFKVAPLMRRSFRRFVLQGRAVANVMKLFTAVSYDFS